ncbi:MAG: MJ1477/TM1410 family putative glycoside hydrolase [Promethearchaeota archaeon]
MKKSIKILVFSIIGIILTSFSGLIYFFDVFYTPTTFTPAQFTINGQIINDFTYLLQFDTYSSSQEAAVDMGELPYDLIVMDYYYDENPWTSDQIETIKSSFSSGTKKIALSYISIGEAEIYRPYWDATWDSNSDGVPDDDAPDWLDIENPDWEGNYKVKYWEKSWQNIIFGSEDSYLDKIIEVGFDGAYLDIIDAYEYYEEQGEPNASQLMIDFVRNLSIYCKGKNPNFLIVPQNGEALGSNPEYLEAIDGIGREDIFYEGNSKNSEDYVKETIDYLDLFLDANLFVLQIEYPSLPRFIRLAYTEGTDNGYVCYVGPRDLDEIHINTNFEPN